MQATAEVDEWLAGLVSERYPVDQAAALDLARKHNEARFYEVDNPEARVDLQAHAARSDATVEMLAIAAWPNAEQVMSALTPWTYMYDLGFHDALARDWKHVNRHWVNLLQPERRSYMEIASEETDVEN